MDSDDTSHIPQDRWNWRKVKRVIKQRAKKLTPGMSYAWGCRGHPGLVIERNYWPGWSHSDLYSADVVIRSLVDGVEESCSIFSCAPMAIPEEEAKRRASEIQTIHSFDLSVMYGYDKDKLRGWLKDWLDRGVKYYVLHDQGGYVVCSSRAFTIEDAEAEVTRLQADWIKERGEITNPRIVDMLTYPAPITLL
jgi:hypothetical protein